MKANLRVCCILLGIVFMVMGFSSNADALGGGFTPGAEGVMAASVPPPGFHYRMYNVLYEADTLTDDNGNDVPIGFDINVLCNAHRLVWITQKKLFGADYGMSTIIPVLGIDLDIDALGVSDGSVGLGDIFIEPLVLAWHKERFDIGLGLGLNLPTGDFDKNNPTNLGNDTYSMVLTLGPTFYLDQEKSWSASFLTRTVVYGEQDDTDITPGDEFFIEWGIAKQFPPKKGVLIRPGICGYNYWQLSEDDGPGVIDDKGQVHAIGAEINFFWLPPHLYQVNLRVMQEFSAEDESEGTKAVLTLTKSW